MASSEFLTALASVRSSLRDLPHTQSPAGRALAGAVRVELSSTDKRNVREALLAGEPLRAANSTYASEGFRQEVGRILMPLVAPLAEALVRGLGAALVHEDAGGLVVRIDSARASHLPRARRRDGLLRGADVREVLSAAVGDPVIVALWATAQSGPNAAPLGFARYAANNSAFVNRQRLFGARVSLASPASGIGDAVAGPTGEAAPGRYAYDFEEALLCAYDEPGDGPGPADRASFRAQDRDEDLEYSVLLETRRAAASFSATAFGIVMDALYGASPRALDALLSGDVDVTLLGPGIRRERARSAGLDEVALLELERAVVQVVREMRLRSVRARDAA